MTRPPARHPALPLLAALGALLVAYLPTLQTIINGSAHYYALDVGETQIVLNVWGTLHATGYPLYALTGSALVAMLRLVGISPAAAPAVVSLLWGLLALGLIYALFAHLTGRAWASAAVVVLFGLARTVWIHHAIAEIYTFGLAILAALLLLALWRRPVRGRLVWLALLGGIGVGHHRAIAFAAPALIYAAWPLLWQDATGDTRSPPGPPSNLKFKIQHVKLVALALAGVFLPYTYLWLRAQAGAAWVYGDPSTLAGLWAQFVGEEANRYLGLPDSWAALRASLAMVNGVLVTDVTLPGLLVGLAGLVAALSAPRLRRAAVTMILSGGLAYAFHVLVYRDVLSALILPVLLAVAFGWLALIDRLLAWAAAQHGLRRWIGWAWVPATAVLAIALVTAHGPFIREVVTDTSGLEAIALAARTPPGHTLMLAWGGQYFAVKYAQDVEPGLAPGLAAIPVVDHRTDFYALAQEGTLVTPAYTLYNQPPAWWVQYLGQEPVLQGAAPGLVAIGLAPGRLADPPDAFGPVNPRVICAPGSLLLDVTWYTPEVPAADLSVFVHAWSADGALLGQGDQAAPVSGWRPLTSWAAGEAVHDVYEVAVDPAAVATLRYGFYRALDSGFENVYEYALPVACGAQ